MPSKKQQGYAFLVVAAFLLLLLQVDGFGITRSSGARLLSRPSSSSCRRRRRPTPRTCTASTTTRLLILLAAASDVDVDAAAVFASRALAGEQQTIQRALVEEELLTTGSTVCPPDATRYALQQPSPDVLQAALQANKKFWKEQQQRQMKMRGRRKTKTGTNKRKKKSSARSSGGMGFQSSSSGSKKKTKMATASTSSSSSSSSSQSAEDDDEPEEELDHVAFNPELDPDGYAAIVRTQGAVRKNQVLSPQTIEPLRQFIDDELDRSLALIREGKIREQARFARVLLKRNRFDMSLPFEQTTDGGDIVMQALWELLGEHDINSKAKNPTTGSVGHIFESALTQNAVLHEFGSLISDPASDRQILHPDMAHQGPVQTRTGPPFLTCFVAVQDIDAAMGPTEFLPGTNTMEAHEHFADHNVRDDFLRQTPCALSLLNQGDASLYDTTTLHAGTANRSDKRRRIFYCTFRSISMKDDRTADEPGSIRADLLQRQLTLRDIRQALYEWRIKKEQEDSKEDIPVVV